MKKNIFLGLLLASCMFVNSTFGYTNEEVGAANFLAKKGIINDNSVNPEGYNLDNPVLRQEIAGIARALANLPKKSYCENKFNDVSATRPNTWACSSIEALLGAGIIAENTNFNPESYISKAEAIGMIVNSAFPGQYYLNTSINASWQTQVVSFAVNKGIVPYFTDYNVNAYRKFIFLAAAKALGYDSYQEPDTGYINPNLPCSPQIVNGYFLPTTNNNSTYNANKKDYIDNGYITSVQQFICNNGSFVKSGTESSVGVCDSSLYTYVSGTKSCVFNSNGQLPNNELPSINPSTPSYPNYGYNCPAQSFRGTYATYYALETNNGETTYPVSGNFRATLKCVNGIFQTIVEENLNF